MLLSIMLIALGLSGWNHSAMALSRSPALSGWQGQPVPITPFDLKIMASGFYSIATEDPPPGQRTFEQIFDRAAAFQYEHDDVGDDWRDPSLTERLKRGDCEDMAVWVYRELRMNGYVNVRIMVGKFEGREKAYHTWTVAESADGESWIVDPALQRRIWKRSELLPELYVPYYSFDGQTKYSHRKSNEPL